MQTLTLGCMSSRSHLLRFRKGCTKSHVYTSTCTRHFCRLGTRQMLACVKGCPAAHTRSSLGFNIRQYETARVHVSLSFSTFDGVTGQSGLTPPMTKVLMPTFLPHQYTPFDLFTKILPCSQSIQWCPCCKGSRRALSAEGGEGVDQHVQRQLIRRAEVEPAGGPTMPQHQAAPHQLHMASNNG